MKFVNLVLITQVVGLCHAGMLNWLLGRDSSPFSPFNSDKDFNTLIEKTEQAKVSAEKRTEGQPDDESLTHALAAIPFELSVADEKFIADAQKYTDISMSELDVCQHKLILQLKMDCNDLSEEDLSKLGVNLLNCQSALEGRKVYPCTSDMTLKDCTRDMDSDTWNAYHIMSNRARSVCYAARQQQFRALTQMTVNKLMASTSEQLEFIHELKEEQKELGHLASETLGSLSKGQEALMQQQEQLKVSQEVASKQIGLTMKEVTRERSAALASQRQMAALSHTLKSTLDQAAMMVRQQEQERQVAQKKLLESLANVENQVGDVWMQLEESVAKLLDQQTHAVHLQSETVQALERLNQTFQFLLTVSEHSKEQLNWIQGLVGNTEKRLGKLSTWLIHVCHLLLGMLLLSFLQAPSYTRWIFLVLVPVNLAMDLQEGYVMEIPAIVTLLLAASLGYRFLIYLKKKINSSASSFKPAAIEYKSRIESTQKKQPILKDPDQSYNFSLLDDSLVESSASRSSTPLPTLDSLGSISHAPVPTMRSILQDRLDLNESNLSCTSTLSYRRSSRIVTGSGSIREESPTRSVTPSKSGTPRRPNTPKRTCAGTRMDGTSCRSVPTKDSDFCWQHK